MSRSDLAPLIVAALRQHGGKAHISQVAKFIWDNHSPELLQAPNLIYSWQYDMRWVAMELRKTGVLAKPNAEAKGIWELA